MFLFSLVCMKMYFLLLMYCDFVQFDGGIFVGMVICDWVERVLVCIKIFVIMENVKCDIRFVILIFIIV